MADRRRIAVALALAAALLAIVTLPGATTATSGGPRSVDRITIADVPDTGGEDCVDDPNAQPGVGLRRCPEAFDVASLLPFVGGGVVILLAAAVGWFLVMRRRVSRPFLADDALAATGSGSGSSASGEWWTCSNCGASNVVGSARCYKCGSWQR